MHGWLFLMIKLSHTCQTRIPSHICHSQKISFTLRSLTNISLSLDSGTCVSKTVPSGCVNRAGAALVYVPATDSVYMFGGVQPDMKTSNDMWCCKRSTPGAWNRVELPADSPRPSARDSFTLTLVGDHLYLFGGCIEGGFANDMWQFDLRTNRFQQVPFFLSYIRLLCHLIFPFLTLPISLTDISHTYPLIHISL